MQSNEMQTTYGMGENQSNAYLSLYTGTIDQEYHGRIQKFSCPRMLTFVFFCIDLFSPQLIYEWVYFKWGEVQFYGGR